MLLTSVVPGRVGPGAAAMDGAPERSAAVYCCTYLCSSGRTVSATQMSPLGVSVM